MSTLPSDGRPVVLLCECAGMMGNIDFGAIEASLAPPARTLRGRHWCSRESQARLIEISENSPATRFVLAGCSQDFAHRQFHGLLTRGLRLEIADIREGCSWVHREDAGLVTDKAKRLIECALAHPGPTADKTSRERLVNTVLVIGGGVAGTQAAVEIARMGHMVELLEQRPFLGGRAARIGVVFPTNDCGQCLPTTDAQIGTRKCFHRNLAIDHPNLHIWRCAAVESVSGRAGDFKVNLRQLPNIVTRACINCGTCETVCRQSNGAGTGKAIYAEFYDGRVPRTIDLETCTFCGACAASCPVKAIDFGQSPRRSTVHAGAVLIAVGCRPAPARFISYLGYGRPGVITQTEFSERMIDWEAQAAFGRAPAREVVMIQCAGSRDKRFLRYCSRLCCMIALKHAIRLRVLFPEMKVRICYLDLRTPGYENWYLAARQAGVEFLRGLPAEVQHDEQGKPVVEVEDMTSGEKRVLRPDLVVLSSGFVPTQDGQRLAQVLGVNLDGDGFIEILDRKNRATETSAEGIFVCGSASGPKALVECNTEASAVASQVHNFLTSLGRLTARPSEILADHCIGCGQCRPACPYGAIALIGRGADALRPEGVRDDAPLAEIDQEACRACGICAAVCPEMAVRHSLSDEAIYGRMRRLMEGVERPVLGFYCKECAGVAISLSGMRHDSYPVDVRLVELPCLGRVSALHIIEAARRGARGVFLAGCAEGRCQFRKGDVNAAQQARQADEFLASAGMSIPIELWHLCAVDRHSVARQIRLFCGKTKGDCDDRNHIRLGPSAGIANGTGVPGVLPVRPVHVGLSERVGSQPGPAACDPAAPVGGHRRDSRL
jgi:heterodisulfide reductase subunit A